MSRTTKRAIQIITAAIVAICASACGGGGGGSSSPDVNRMPVVAGESLRADGAALDSIEVLANDSDPDGDPLTVTIEEAPLASTASVNANGTVRLADLPSGFKGFTRFKYRVADPLGASALATAAIFVGVDPFRVAFAGDASQPGSTEIYVTDFVSPARAITAATEGNFRLRGFVASDNGATVVYRREDETTPAAADLSFVQTANTTQQVRVALPGGVAPLQDAQGNDQFRVSPDGQWIAMVAGAGNVAAVYVLNVADPATVTQVSPATAVYVALPRFSPNSQMLYFLASDVPGGGNKSLHTVALADPGASAQISAPISPGSADDVLEYSVAPDQSRILLQARRANRVGLYFVDPSQLQTEIQVSHTLVSDETILESTIGLAPGSGGSALGERVAYTTQSLLTLTSYVAEVSATPDPRAVATAGARVIGLRPDDDALLYSRGGDVLETVIDSGDADQLVGAGSFGWYDSTGNIVLLEQFLPSGGSPPTYPALAAALRGSSFGTTQALGTPALAAHFINTTGTDRGIVIVGEGATTGAAPTSARLALVNAMVPEDLVYLADFESPLQLTSDSAQVVGH